MPLKCQIPIYNENITITVGRFMKEVGGSVDAFLQTKVYFSRLSDRRRQMTLPIRRACQAAT